MIIKSKGDNQTKKSYITGKVPINPAIDPNFIHIPFKANPIKHYRNQYGRSGSKVSIDHVNQPGSYNANSKCNVCNFANCNCGIHFNDASVLKTEKYDDCCPGYNKNANRVQKNALTRVRNGYRKPQNEDGTYSYSGNNNLDKKYYNSNHQYLNHKNKLLKNVQIVEKDEKGNAFVRTCNCNDNLNDHQKRNSFYMSNRKHMMFTSTDSSARTNRIRYETINTAAKTLCSEYGSNVAKTVEYNSRTEVPFVILKNKPTTCNVINRRGRNNMNTNKDQCNK